MVLFRGMKRANERKKVMLKAKLIYGWSKYDTAADGMRSPRCFEYENLWCYCIVKQRHIDSEKKCRQTNGKLIPNTVMYSFSKFHHRKKKCTQTNTHAHTYDYIYFWCLWQRKKTLKWINICANGVRVPGTRAQPFPTFMNVKKIYTQKQW